MLGCSICAFCSPVLSIPNILFTYIDVLSFTSIPSQWMITIDKFQLYYYNQIANIRKSSDTRTHTHTIFTNISIIISSIVVSANHCLPYSFYHFPFLGTHIFISKSFEFSVCRIRFLYGVERDIIHQWLWIIVIRLMEYWENLYFEHLKYDIFGFFVFEIVCYPLYPFTYEPSIAFPLSPITLQSVQLLRLFILLC